MKVSSRSSVRMMAVKSSTKIEIEKETDEDMDGYWEENVKIVPELALNKDTKNYWDEQMKNRDPIKLPYWVLDVDDGAQMIKNNEKRKIGWIGLGQTGHQIAFLLVKAGYDVTVYDKDKSKANDLIKFGAKLANSANDLA